MRKPSAGYLAIRIEWTQPALDTLATIRDYIAEDSPQNALIFIQRIFDAAAKLTDFPERGRHVPEASDHNDVRELVFKNYRIIYQIKPKQVDILAVMHCRQHLATHKDKPWDV